jgi:4-hydroxythreonine-4-phosphate dehydrogenase
MAEVILITPGDPAGIGPEIVWKSLLKPKYAHSRRHRFVCVGAIEPFTKKLGRRALAVCEADLATERLKKLPRDKLLVLPAPRQTPRTGLLLEGFQAGWAIEKAAQLIQTGAAQALVTGPISKERLQAGGFPYSGHTDFLAALCGAQEAARDVTHNVTMMLANDLLRVSLVTVHIALKDVSAALTRASLRRAVLHTADALRRWWGIRSPRIAVAALNPHAGENGLFGQEEIRVIAPELLALKKEKSLDGVTLAGPFPADTLFATSLKRPTRQKHPKEKVYDAVVCMYHDQGLIPVKLLDFQRTVNVTLGLPIIRTSVDHGVAFDIAGKNQADPSSLQSAIDLAVKFVGRKRSS